LRRWLWVAAAQSPCWRWPGSPARSRNGTRPVRLCAVCPNDQLGYGRGCDGARAGIAAPTTSMDGDLPKTVFTYFFYWYDATTGRTWGGRRIAGAPARDPAPSWRSEDWFAKELTDMQEAGIDVVLPVYWGDTEPWSIDGLTAMASPSGGSRRGAKIRLTLACSSTQQFSTGRT